MNKPYDLTALDPMRLDELLAKRPDLRKEIFAEADRRAALSHDHDVRDIESSPYADPCGD